MYLRLKFEIKKNGYTIEKFARLIGMSEKSLRNKLNSVTDFTWSECLLIHSILPKELSLEELFTKEISLKASS